VPDYDGIKHSETLRREKLITVSFPRIYALNASHYTERCVALLP
jgi:hypothetical protein